jgi:hypothetical protein
MASALKTSAFRQIVTIPGQIAFFREERGDGEPIFVWEAITELFGKPTSTLRRWERLHAEGKDAPYFKICDDLKMLGPNGFLTVGEENNVLEWIRKAQIAKNCPTSGQVRDYATDLRRQRNFDHRVATKHWWASFRNRHPEVASTKTSGIEAARTHVPAQAVNDYFSNVQTALASMTSREQLLNMDETGFCSREMKNRKKTVVFLTNCPVVAKYTEETDADHVSLAATISFSGLPLKPMFLTRREIRFTSPALQDLSDDIAVCTTAKAYQTEASMRQYLHQVIAPYCAELRHRREDPELPVFLIMDNCSSHRTDELFRIYDELNVRPIWLPPHSSHFLQPLDLGIFGTLKETFRKTPKPPATRGAPALERKILRIHQASYRVFYSLQIKASWTAAAIMGHLNCRSLWHVDQQKVEAKIRGNCVAEA